MERPTIILGVKIKEYGKVLALAMRVYDHLNNNPRYLSPNPGMAVLNIHIVKLREAIIKWGLQGNRGSHKDHENLHYASTQMVILLRPLAAYCTNTAYQNAAAGELATVLLSSGFTLKRQKVKQGRLEMVQDLHHFIARNIRLGEAKLRWKRPLNVRTSTNVKYYEIRRSNTPDFVSSSVIGFATATTFTDSPGTGQYYYWVIPYNCMGAGVTSEILGVFVR